MFQTYEAANLLEGPFDSCSRASSPSMSDFSGDDEDVVPYCAVGTCADARSAGESLASSEKALVGAFRCWRLLFGKRPKHRGALRFSESDLRCKCHNQPLKNSRSYCSNCVAGRCNPEFWGETFGTFKVPCFVFKNAAIRLNDSTCRRNPCYDPKTQPMLRGGESDEKRVADFGVSARFDNERIEDVAFRRVVELMCCEFQGPGLCRLVQVCDDGQIKVWQTQSWGMFEGDPPKNDCKHFVHVGVDWTDIKHDIADSVSIP